MEEASSDIGFKVLGKKKRKKLYEFLIRGPLGFGLDDLISYMPSVSEIRNYRLKQEDFYDQNTLRIIQKKKEKDPEYTGARVYFETTLDNKIARISVEDDKKYPLGKSLIEDFICSVEERT